MHAARLGDDAARAAGQVVVGALADGPTVRGSKHTRSANAPGRDAAAVAQAVEAGRLVGEQAHGLLEREVAVAHRVADHERGVRGAAHHVEVRAGVGAADHRPRVAPHVDAHLPGLFGLGAAEVGAQAGAQLVGDDDVEERVERRLALFLRRCRRSCRPSNARVSGVNAFDDLEALPAGEVREHAGLGGVGLLVEPGAHGRVGERADALGHRQRDGLAPARQAVEHEPGEEREPDLHALAAA